MLEAYNNAVAKIERPASNGLGGRTYTTVAASAGCRFEGGGELVSDENGRQVSSKAAALFPAGNDVRLGDRITIDSAAYTVAAVTPLADFTARGLKAELI